RAFIFFASIAHPRPRSRSPKLTVSLGGLFLACHQAKTGRDDACRLVVQCAESERLRTVPAASSGLLAPGLSAWRLSWRHRPPQLEQVWWGSRPYLSFVISRALSFAPPIVL